MKTIKKKLRVLEKKAEKTHGPAGESVIRELV